MPIICPECHAAKKLTNNCRSCGWLFSEKEGFPFYFNRRDSSSDYFKKYLDNYKKIAIDDLESSMQDIEYIKAQTDKMYSYFPSLDGKVVAEVGVGQGNLFRKIASSGAKVLYGVDIAIDYLMKLKDIKNSEIIIANAENLPFENEFDLVVATDILEHVLNPGDFMVSLNRSLKIGGYCIVRVPFHENLIKYSRQKGCPYEFVHLRTYNKPLLKSEFHNSGFEFVRFEYDGFIRKNIRNFWGPLSLIVGFLVDKVWKNPKRIYRINNILGRILFNPVEISIVAIKVRNI